MKIAYTVVVCGLGMVLGTSLATIGHAQGSNAGPGSSEEQRARMPLPEVEPPPRDFSTAEEHYNYLLEQADGGTEHTMATIPVWDGLWGSGNNTMPELFLEGGSLAIAMSPGGSIKEGVLTPAYEQHFSERRAELEQYGEQLYDHLTNCEYPGAARWLWEPYIKEFVNTPRQSWMLNDMMNESRRIYVGGHHVNIEGTHSSTGDSIGFWDDDKLVIWTKWIHPADYLRGMPLTSNQLEMVETWQQVTSEGGARQLFTQVTFYDPIGLVRPLSAVYSHNDRPDLEELGVRIRNWECETSSNSYRAEDGTTQFYLPAIPSTRIPGALRISRISLASRSILSMKAIVHDRSSTTGIQTLAGVRGVTARVRKEEDDDEEADFLCGCRVCDRCAVYDRAGICPPFVRDVRYRSGNVDRRTCR